MVRTFSYERSTKNTHVFVEDQDSGGTMCGTIYIQKMVFPDQVPAKIKVTVESA